MRDFPLSETDALSKAVWIERFGKRLQQLHPSLNPLAVVNASIEAFRQEHDAWPERVAERVASTNQFKSRARPD